MKRFTLVLALLLMVSMPMMAERVTPEAARKVATTFLNNNGAKASQLTDLSKEAGFTNLYIFNGNPGFVVMAADDCVQPILGYSLTGKFVAENMPTNVSGWLQGYNDEIQYAVDSKMKATNEIAQLWKDLAEGNSKTAKATVVVDALIQTTWDQDPRYNALCPYDSNAGELTVTGCVATAMAQIMKYWDYPTSGSGSHSYNHSTYGTQSANFGSTTYHWENMPAYLSSSSTTEQINEIAQLMYHCGVSVNMNYGLSADGGSSASTQAVGNALINYFKYSSGITYKEKSKHTDTNWKNLVKAELDAGRPLQYRGQGSGGGHSFVCCGYDSDDKFYFNWGWSGTNDGFYSLSSLVPGSGGSGGGSYSFTTGQAALFGIQPMATTTSTPTNFNLATEGRNAVLTWDATENAASYYVYRDGLAIANTTATTYTDNDLGYGSYDYYIKSRDVNGASPAPTGILTAVIEPVASNLTVTKNGNNAVLNWTEPEWCLPSTDDEVLTYGDGSIAYIYGANNGRKYYVGQRYSTSMLATNKVLYKVSFYAVVPGSFSLLVYTSAPNASYPASPAVLEQSINTTIPGWVDIEITTPLQLDETKDLWVFIYDPEGKEYPFAIGEYSGSDGGYYSYDPYNPTTLMGSIGGGAYTILLRTYITDGAFIYNLYDGTTSVASNISGSTYTVNNITNNTAHQYTLKTNFNGGLTIASNMAGLTIGAAQLSSLILGTNDQMTVTEGSKLTVNGALSSAGPNNLILENGAQLVNESEDVQATVKKDISPYTADDNGWYFIASPVTESFEPTEQNGLLANNFDLYLFDQSQASEWLNYKANSFSTLNHKTGYLYANSGNTTLNFVGTLAASADATSLVYAANATFKGFNLIGNPYPCNTTITNDFYIISGSTVTLAENGRAIAPCEGVFVKATDENQTVTFSKVTSAKDSTPRNCIDLVVSQGKATTDRARVRFSEGIGMEKFSLDEKHSQISLWQDGQDYAVAYAEGMSEMPVNFAAAQDDTYTLSVENEGLDLDYLHLIDNMTGEDVDLLATPSYTFEGKTTDYASRFRLLFAPICEDADGDNDIFAYYADGEIRLVGETHVHASLQVMDMTGRVIVCSDIARNISTAGMTPDVYVLRLIDGETIQTQKIVLH